MPKLGDVCRNVRSKNAGPFWITVDFFFSSRAAYDGYKDCPALGSETFSQLYGVDASLVHRYELDNLRVLKVSYPRPRPQGWYGERDMHSGQQFAPLMKLELGPPMRRSP